MKAQRIIERAFSLLGIKALGQPLDGDTLEEGFLVLNEMLGTLQLSKLYIPYSVEVSANVVGSQATVGIGGVFNTERPLRIKQGFVRKNSTKDNPIVFLTAREYYDEPLKLQAGTIENPCAYYAPTMPEGTIYFYPSLNDEVHLIIDKHLGAFTDYTTDYALPPEYTHFLQYELAINLAPTFREPSSLVVETARVARLNIMKQNTQPVYPERDMLTTYEAFMAGL